MNTPHHHMVESMCISYINTRLKRIPEMSVVEVIIVSKKTCLDMRVEMVANLRSVPLNGGYRQESVALWLRRQ